MRRIEGYIPRNLGGGTFLDGRIQVRNAMEAAIVIVIIYFITKIMGLFIPYLITVIIRVVLWAVFGFLAAVGINGEPLSIFILDVINYSNSRTYVTLRPPQRELQNSRKKDPKEKAIKNKKEKKPLKDRILTKEPKKHGRKKD